MHTAVSKRGIPRGETGRVIPGLTRQTFYLDTPVVGRLMLSFAYVPSGGKALAPKVDMKLSSLPGCLFRAPNPLGEQ